MKYLAAFHLMEREKGWFLFQLGSFRLKGIKYIPLSSGSEISDDVAAWKWALEVAQSMMSDPYRKFHHIEKVEMFILTSSEPYPYVPGRSKAEAVCTHCNPASNLKPQEAVVADVR